METTTRRRFLGQVLAGAATAAGAPGLLHAVESAATRRSATDQVPLGKTGVTICRLGFGTGSMGGKVQRDLGQEGFSRLLKHAYDRGITYIDTAQNYRIHEMVAKAIKELPRDKLFIQTKIPWADRPDVAKSLDQYRRELGVEYIDSVLIHCVRSLDWSEDLKYMRDALSEAKEKKIIRLHGASCHGLSALEGVSRENWCDVNLVRINPQSRHTDGPTGTWAEPGNIEEGVKHIQKIHEAGRGVIGMKIIGNGDFTDAAEREKSIPFAMTRDFVDAVVIGFKSPAEINEAIRRINAALTA